MSVSASLRSIRKHTIRKTPLASSLAALLAVSASAHDASEIAQVGRSSLGHVFRAQPADASIFVTNCDDDGPGSLRQAVESASAGDTIEFATTCSTITLTSGEIATSVQVDIEGPGSDLLTIDGGSNGRVFRFENDASLEGLTLRNGDVEGNGGCVEGAGELDLTDVHVESCTARGEAVSGGAIYAVQKLTLTDSSVRDGHAMATSGRALGGGVNSRILYAQVASISDSSAEATSYYAVGGGAFASYSMTLSNTTIDGNRANAGAGVALFGANAPAARLVLSSSTVSGNRAGRHIGGVFSDSPTRIYDSTIAFNCGADQNDAYIAAFGLHTRNNAPYLGNTIIADNTFCASGDATADTTAYDFSMFATNGAAVTGGHNLIVASSVAVPADTLVEDPRLAALADNGGATRTHALLDGSPAIDAGFITSHDNRGYDQRSTGIARTVGGAPDIGAYERQSTGVTRQVTRCADGGAGSLRDTVMAAQSGDTIDLGSIGCSTLSLTSGEIVMPQGNVRVLGPGASMFDIDAGDASRVFRHDGIGTLDLEGMTISHGATPFGAVDGGCVFSRSFVHADGVTIEHCNAHAQGDDMRGGALFAHGASIVGSVIRDSACTISAMERCVGGGMYIAGPLRLERSSIAGNNATLAGGGLAAFTAAIIGSTISGNGATDFAGAFGNDLRLVDSTISNNQASDESGGIFGVRLAIWNSTVALNKAAANDVASAGVGASEPMRLESTIAFANTTGDAQDDVGTSAVIFGSHDLVGASSSLLPDDTLRDDPELGPLQDNGGGIETHALGAGSPALDVGNNVLGLIDDERGDAYPREVGISADIGAYEAQGTNGDDDIFIGDFDPDSRPTQPPA